MHFIHLSKKPLTKNQILVDSVDFKNRLEELVPKAKNRVYVQSMTFEGDEVGKWLIGLLLKSKAKDIRLCVDSYSKFVINDHFVFSPKYILDASFRKEVRETNKFLKIAQEHGIKVTITNPLGFLFLKYPFRNHKKMVVVDEVSFIGGINFSQHNFEWHDMMAELHDLRLSDLLAEDVKSTGNRINQNKKNTIGSSELYFLDGWISRKKYKNIFSTLKQAKKNIYIFSPYISDPLLSYIQNNISANVEMTVISPKQNNKSLFKSLLLNEVLKGYFSLKLYQNQMSHLKAILVDDEVLIFGSSNFDFVSYYFEQEVVLVTHDKKIVLDFIEKVKNPDLSKSIPLSTLKSKRNIIALVTYKIVISASAIIAMVHGVLRHSKNRLH